MKHMQSDDASRNLNVNMSILMSTCLNISKHSAFDLPMTITQYSHAFHFINIFHLYVHTGSPIVTSLTFNNQTRTLTCTSTGGPATNVTWRRDGVVIKLNATHQQTKRLVDSVNGTYQTVLTINSSVCQSDILGSYNCTVENDRGESSETVVVQG